MHHSSLDMPICIPFSKAENLTGKILMAEIEKVIQSNKELSIMDGDMPLDITHTILLEGAGRQKHYGAYFNTESMRETKRCIIKIENARDTMCFARAGVVGMCRENKSDTIRWKREWNLIQRSRHSYQKLCAEQLLEKVGVKLDKP